MKYHNFWTLCFLIFTTSTLAGPNKTEFAVGSDRDSHGCIASAGYLWSPLRSECIRLFEAGLAFTPETVTGKGSSQLAYLVLPSADIAPIRHVELYMPGQFEPIQLQTQNNPEGDIRPTLLINRAEKVRLIRVKDEHVLDARGQRFRRASPPHDRLFELR